MSRNCIYFSSQILSIRYKLFRYVVSVEIFDPCVVYPHGVIRLCLFFFFFSSSRLCQKGRRKQNWSRKIKKGEGKKSENSRISWGVQKFSVNSGISKGIQSTLPRVSQDILWNSYEWSRTENIFSVLFLHWIMYYYTILLRFDKTEV